MALILALTKNFHNVNALCVIGSAVFVWAVTFAVGGWNFAYRLLPCLLLLLLGTPSSSYRLAQLFTLPTAAAIIALVVDSFTKRPPLQLFLTPFYSRINRL